MIPIQQENFPQKRFYGICCSQRPTACVGVNQKRCDRSTLINFIQVEDYYESCERLGMIVIKMRHELRVGPSYGLRSDFKNF